MYCTTILMLIISKTCYIHKHIHKNNNFVKFMHYSDLENVKETLEQLAKLSTGSVSIASIYTRYYDASSQICSIN